MRNSHRQFKVATALKEAEAIKVTLVGLVSSLTSFRLQQDGAEYVLLLRRPIHSLTGEDVRRIFIDRGMQKKRGKQNVLQKHSQSKENARSPIF